MAGKTKILRKKIDIYLENLLVAILIFKDGIEAYLKKDNETFHRKVQEISLRESELDQIRREAEQSLYSHMLLPESRGDILGLLENLDDIANFSEEILKNFKAENPHIPEEYHGDFNLIIQKSVDAVQQLISGVTGYFTNMRNVSTLMAQVSYFEHEVDEVYESLITRIFQNSELDLSRKIHIRYFAEKLIRLTDIAEDVSERVVISTLKREI